MPESLPWNSYSSYLEKKYGYRIWRVGVDAGFSCPNRSADRHGGCVYCDALGSAAAYQRSFDGNEVRFQNIKDQIERGRSFLKRRYKAEHFALYFQAFSNTFASVEKLREIYDAGLEGNTWDALIVSTRPDCIDERKVALLSSYKDRGLEVCVELGLQSGCDEILKAMNRGHDVSCFLKASELITRASLELSVHTLLGFPGEGERELALTADAVNKSGARFVKLHNLNIIEGTVLYEKYLKGEARAPELQEYVVKACFLLRRIKPDIVVERLICDTPDGRLVSPKDFPDKTAFIRILSQYMDSKGFRQGDLFI